jgi:hypothetical protein
MKGKVTMRRKRGTLLGMVEISEYTGYTIPDLMDFALFWPSCPLRKLEAENIWVVKKSDIQKFIKEKVPPQTEIVEVKLIKSPKQIQWRRKRW